MGVRLCYFGFTGASSQSSGCGDEGGPSLPVRALAERLFGLRMVGKYRVNVCLALYLGEPLAQAFSPESLRAATRKMLKSGLHGHSEPQAEGS